jgi:endonuclease-3
VDTHVFRLANRLKICSGKTPAEVQEKLEKIVPPKYKSSFALAMVLLGRYICQARKPKCEECPLYTDTNGG